jgi:protein TonB
MKSRTLVIVASVVLFHVAALWALHQGLLQRMVDVVVPVMAISQADPPPPPPPKPPEPVKSPEPPKTPPPPKPVQPVLTPPPTPQPSSPATPEPPAVLAAPTAAPTVPAVSAAPPAPPPPAPVVSAAPSPTSSHASPKPVEDTLEGGTPLAEFLTKEYLEQLNRKFSKSMSGRMGEHGKVLLEVIVDKSGQVKSALVLNPSPFPRLDKFAQDVVATWKFKPAKRNGVPEEITVKVPFAFEEQKN